MDSHLKGMIIGTPTRSDRVTYLEGNVQKPVFFLLPTCAEDSSLYRGTLINLSFIG